jgi:hypothetical protein
MDESIHQSILDTLSAKESTPFCLQRFEELFQKPLDKFNQEMELDWKEDSPEKLLIKGRGVIQLYTGSSLFRLLNPILVNQQVMMNLTSLNNKTMSPSFYPSLCFPSDDISVCCPVDAVLSDGTIIDIYISSRQMPEENLIRKLLYDFYLLATLYMPQICLKTEQSVRCDVLIRTTMPKLQVVQFTKKWQDFMRLLDFLYSVLSAIQNELFFPTPNILCSNHCAYKANCHPIIACPGLSPGSKNNWRENLYKSLDFYNALSDH